MTKKSIPEKEAQWIDAAGRPTPAFLEYIKDLDARAPAQKVIGTTPTNGQFLVYSTATGAWSLQPTVAPTNGQVLIYNSVSGTWVAGAN